MKNKYKIGIVYILITSLIGVFVSAGINTVYAQTINADELEIVNLDLLKSYTQYNEKTQSIYYYLLEATLAGYRPKVFASKTLSVQTIYKTYYQIYFDIAYDETEYMEAVRTGSKIEIWRYIRREAKKIGLEVANPQLKAISL